jgi:hypothetical protein
MCNPSQQKAVRPDWHLLLHKIAQTEAYQQLGPPFNNHLMIETARENIIYHARK